MERLEPENGGEALSLRPYGSLSHKKTKHGGFCGSYSEMKGYLLKLVEYLIPNASCHILTGTNDAPFPRRVLFQATKHLWNSS